MFYISFIKKDLLIKKSYLKKLVIDCCFLIFFFVGSICDETTKTRDPSRADLNLNIDEYAIK